MAVMALGDQACCASIGTARQGTFGFSVGSKLPVSSNATYRDLAYLSLVLLCHKRGTQQTGQQGSCLSRNLASLIRSVAIECGLCRSARTRRAARPEVGRNFLGA